MIIHDRDDTWTHITPEPARIVSVHVLFIYLRIIRTVNCLTNGWRVFWTVQLRYQFWSKWRRMQVDMLHDKSQSYDFFSICKDASCDRFSWQPSPWLESTGWRVMIRVGIPSFVAKNLRLTLFSPNSLMLNTTKHCRYHGCINTSSKMMRQFLVSSSKMPREDLRFLAAWCLSLKLNLFQITENYELCIVHLSLIRTQIAWIAWFCL